MMFVIYSSITGLPGGATARGGRGSRSTQAEGVRLRKTTAWVGERAAAHAQQLPGKCFRCIVDEVSIPSLPA